ncbi:Crp/Fnr family transcriptional regulator [Methylobacterium sp. J-090]|uniref:Crp/Fnr family transcriptional regulator n=1 Tax=Methylobacterium sp. J-090 TaxID=2836666 RepID=UPI001FBA355A|nr:Crp/Fnr family transcriptional regulator [Methylobacterium sp. J-090]MCJ2082990.1 Crp/Fnr family transcriptional regulator [Methylobacterium sp. J-090]
MRQPAGFVKSGAAGDNAQARAMTRPKANPFRRKLESLVPLSAAAGDHLEEITTIYDSHPTRANLVPREDMRGGRLVLMEGFACHYRTVAGGRRQIIAYLVPGDSYDLDTALQNRPDHVMMALTPVRIVRLARAAVADATQDHPAIAEGLRVAGQVEEATVREWLVDIGGRPALERIAHLFCELELRLRAVGLAEADRFDMPITQCDLADTVGLSSVHVNRTLQELRRQRLITLSGRTLTILNRSTFQAMAGFRPDYLRLRETI